MGSEMCIRDSLLTYLLSCLLAYLLFPCLLLSVHHSVFDASIDRYNVYKVETTLYPAPLHYTSFPVPWHIVSLQCDVWTKWRQLAMRTWWRAVYRLSTSVMRKKCHFLHWNFWNPSKITSFHTCLNRRYNCGLDSTLVGRCLILSSRHDTKSNQIKYRSNQAYLIRPTRSINRVMCE